MNSRGASPAPRRRSAKPPSSDAAAMTAPHVTRVVRVRADVDGIRGKADDERAPGENVDAVDRLDAPGGGEPLRYRVQHTLGPSLSVLGTPLKRLIAADQRRQHDACHYLQLDRR